MGKLTGKAKESFLKWYRDRLSVMTYSELLNINDETVYNSLIIEWFDSVGIHVKIYPHLGGGQVVFYPTVMFLDEQHNTNEKDVLFDNGEFYYHESRTEAINNAISKANEIYNK